MSTAALVSTRDTPVDAQKEQSDPQKQPLTNGSNHSSEQSTTNDKAAGAVLSSDLTKVLSQISRSGACPGIPWTHAPPQLLPVPKRPDASTKKPDNSGGAFRAPTYYGPSPSKKSRLSNGSTSTITTQQRKRPLLVLRSSNPYSGSDSDSEATSTHSEVYPDSTSLREVVRNSMILVLDSYNAQHSYKLAPSEKSLDSATAFARRKQSLLQLLPETPPFTLQRVAEVLLTPERYYKQTHKLCNCLQKLLLVQASASDFGGSFGGDSWQRRREDMELKALAEERHRLHEEFRQRRMERRASNMSEDTGSTDDKGTTPTPLSPNPKDVLLSGTSSVGSPGDGLEATEGESPEEMLEAAARASLRSKFDHVGIDPHSPTGPRDVRAMVDRGLTNSPPPPALATLRHGHDEHHHGVNRPPSPILFNAGGAPPEAPAIPAAHANPNIHLLQVHHAAALAGVSPLDLIGLAAAKEADFESRSSASSDFDSESDVSFDDSASDRSDDSTPEGIAAARAIALNRQRLAMFQKGEVDEAAPAEDSGGSDSSDMVE